MSWSCQGLLELALASRRIYFLNSETINDVISHMWQTVDFSNPYSNPYFMSTQLNQLEMFELLLKKPFYFYLSPIGYLWSTRFLYVTWCVMITLYLNGNLETDHRGTHQTDAFPNPSLTDPKFLLEMAVWMGGVGFIFEEIRHYLTQGRFTPYIITCPLVGVSTLCHNVLVLLIQNVFHHQFPQQFLGHFTIAQHHDAADITSAGCRESG